MSPSRPRLLDLFCGAGGAAMGYYRAGFDVVGVDIKPQPNYPFEFVLADALEVLSCLLDPDAAEHYEDWLPATKLILPFAGIHASPPCQAYSKTRHIMRREHPDLIAPTRELLEATALPYVIENVPGAPLRDPLLIDGEMFGGCLRTVRPRLFEVNWPLKVSFLRHPAPAPYAEMGRQPKTHEYMHVVGHFVDLAAGRRAMGIDWMTRDELAQAIPPTYTELIGHQLMQHIKAVAA